MIHDPDAELLQEPTSATVRMRRRARRSYQLVNWVFAGNSVKESVATRMHFHASPEAVWRHLMFYEEVPGPPPFLLRKMLLHPVQTEGDKRRLGGAVRCTYRYGDMVKRVTAVEPPHLLRFEVVEQCLGIEGCVRAVSGSYQIFICGAAADVLLVTDYQAHLHPRSLWRPLEACLVRQLHGHILGGLSDALLSLGSEKGPAIKTQLAPQVARGELACTMSPSYIRRWS